MAWVPWNIMCKSKKLGVPGFKDFSLFNQAMSAKQGWRLIQSPHSLFGKFQKAKYFPSKDFLTATVGKQPSFAW